MKQKISQDFPRLKNFPPAVWSKVKVVSIGSEEFSSSNATSPFEWLHEMKVAKLHAQNQVQ